MKLIAIPRVLFLSFSVWILFYLSIPAHYKFKGTAYFALTVMISYLCFFGMGYFSIAKSSLNHLRPYANRKIRQITYFLFALGSAGVIVKMYAGLFVTKIFLASNLAEKREELFGGEFNSGVFGIIGALLFPFAVISALLVIYNIRLFKKRFIIPCLLFGMYPFLETFFLGGRTVIVLLGTTLTLVSYLSYLKNSRLPISTIRLGSIPLFSVPRILVKKRVLIVTGLLGLLFVSYSVSVISSRLELFDYKDTLEVWEGYHEVDIDNDFQKEVNTMKKADKNYAIGMYSLKHYFAHGVFEYIRLVNHLESYSGYYYGGYQFYVFTKFFKFFGLPVASFQEMNTVSYKPAVYTTFWGPFFIDFGVFGIIIAFFWGRFTRRIYLKAVQGLSPHVIFYCFIAVLALASFFVNFIIGGSSYYLFGFIVTIIIFKIWPENAHFVLR